MCCVPSFLTLITEGKAVPEIERGMYVCIVVIFLYKIVVIAFV